MLTTELHLVLRLRNNEAIPLLPTLCLLQHAGTTFAVPFFVSAVWCWSIFNFYRTLKFITMFAGDHCCGTVHSQLCSADSLDRSSVFCYI